MRRGLLEARRCLTPQPGPLGTLCSPRVLIFTQVGLCLAPSPTIHPLHRPQGAREGKERSTSPLCSARLAGENFPLCELGLVFVVMMNEETVCVCVCEMWAHTHTHPTLPYQTASGHTDVQGSRLTQGPVLDLFGVTDVEAEATGAAVEFAALEALDWGQVGRRLAGGPAGT